MVGSVQIICSITVGAINIVWLVLIAWILFLVWPTLIGVHLVSDSLVWFHGYSRLDMLEFGPSQAQLVYSFSYQVLIIFIWRRIAVSDY